MMQMDFWFEFASTYSYPAALRVEQVASEHGVKIRWRPFLLGPIFKSQGWTDSPFNIYPTKGRYMWRDLERISADLGLPFRRPSSFPRNGLLAARIACQFSEAPWVPEFVRSVYRANFEQDQDIGASETVASCLRNAGQEPGPVLSVSESIESKDRLRKQSEEAFQLGIFGAPSFVIGSELLGQ
jgi:2-hydroxychromene-2-carboxylate isomerase